MDPMSFVAGGATVLAAGMVFGALKKSSASGSNSNTVECFPAPPPPPPMPAHKKTPARVTIHVDDMGAVIRNAVGEGAGDCARVAKKSTAAARRAEKQDAKKLLAVTTSDLSSVRLRVSASSSSSGSKAAPAFEVNHVPFCRDCLAQKGRLRTVVATPTKR